MCVNGLNHFKRYNMNYAISFSISGKFKKAKNWFKKIRTLWSSVLQKLKTPLKILAQSLRNVKLNSLIVCVSSVEVETDKTFCSFLILLCLIIAFDLAKIDWLEWSNFLYFIPIKNLVKYTVKLARANFFPQLKLPADAGKDLRR